MVQFLPSSGLATAVRANDRTLNEMTTTEAPTIPTPIVLSYEESAALFESEVRELLGISAADFEQR